MKKRMSIIVPFEVMKTCIKQGEHWVRTDWTNNDKYVIMADERCCTPCLLLVYRDTDSYVIFRPTYNDIKYSWKKVEKY